MARQSANSLLNSLKGKIWLATSALAFFISTFGMITYLGVSFLIQETFYAVFIPFLLLSFTVMIFGWWLSNEVIGPIEKVSLLAKSLERGSSITLPKTSGSTETDELLATLHRNSQQLQNLVGLMDKVAGGNLNVVLTPLENSDRLSNSFQKLLSKVTESINAKSDLEKLRAALTEISEDTSGVRTGDFDARVKTGNPETREIADTMQFLLDRIGELIIQVRENSRSAHKAASTSGKLIETLIQQSENHYQAMNQAQVPLKQIPNSVQRIVDELSGSVSSANTSIERARYGSQTAQQNLEAIRELRKQLNEAVMGISRLTERTDEISRVAKTVGDLSHRTNMIALNASIHAGDSNDKSKRFAILEEEVERLAVRSDNTHRQISSLNKTIAAEISEIERSLQATIGEAANLSKFAIETGDTLSELEKYVGQFLNLQIKVVSFSSEKSDETNRAYQIFANSIPEAQNAVEDLKKAQVEITGISDWMNSLQIAVETFKCAEIVTSDSDAIQVGPAELMEPGTPDEFPFPDTNQMLEKQV